MGMSIDINVYSKTKIVEALKQYKVTDAIDLTATAFVEKVLENLVKEDAGIVIGDHVIVQGADYWDDNDPHDSLAYALSEYLWVIEDDEFINYDRGHDALRSARTHWVYSGCEVDDLLDGITVNRDE